MGLLIIGGVLYYTGALPVVWDHLKNAGTACYSLMNSVGVGGQSVCGAVNGMMTSIDNSISGMGDGMGDWFSDQSSDARMSMESVTKQFDGILDSFKGGSGFGSTQSSLDALMKMGPNSLSTGGGDLSQLQGAMNSFAIGQKLMGSQPSLGNQWMQKGASMGEFGLVPQLSLGNSFAQSGNNAAALNYYQQALGSLNALQSSNSPASQQLLGSMPVSPDKLQQQITAAIRQMQIGR